MKDLWRPISELANKHEPFLLLASPELIDLDFNTQGVSEGFWQHDEGWKCRGWDSCNDEFSTVILKEPPTHFIILQGPWTPEEAEKLWDLQKQKEEAQARQEALDKSTEESDRFTQSM